MAPPLATLTWFGRTEPERGEVMNILTPEEQDILEQQLEDVKGG